MASRMIMPVTARRLRKKRFATSAPGERTCTRRSSLREYCSLLSSLFGEEALLFFTASSVIFSAWRRAAFPGTE